VNQGARTVDEYVEAEEPLHVVNIHLLSAYRDLALCSPR